MSEHTKLIEPGVFMSEAQLLQNDRPQPLGLTIVGEAQAGKTCLRGMVHDEWNSRFPDVPVLDFSNSNGYRGITLATLEHNAVPPDEIVGDADFLSMLHDFMATHEGDLPDILDGFYISPRPDGELRAPSVNATVAIASEIQTIRNVVNAAGARFLGQVMLTPELANLPAAPGLVIIDGRDAKESHKKYEDAGVRSIGTIVMTCPEAVVARRLLGKDASEEAIATETARLTQRNSIDRERMAAPMTLPEDFEHWLPLDELLTDSDPEASARNAGTIMAHNPNVCIVVPTDKLTLPEEARGLKYLLSGILRTADVAK